MTEENHALNQARAQYSSICEMVAALEVDYDRLDELKDEFESEMSKEDRSEWIKQNCGEFAELLQAANDCENRDAAYDRIQEDPLSVEVRSGWYSPGSDPSSRYPEEFQILLCTGGPAVRIVGELDENGTPTRAWMEYQDWGTPWTMYLGASEEVLLKYCEQFYFGG